MRCSETYSEILIRRKFDQQNSKWKEMGRYSPELNKMLPIGGCA